MDLVVFGDHDSSMSASPSHQLNDAGQLHCLASNEAMQMQTTSIV